MCRCESRDVWGRPVRRSRRVHGSRDFLHVLVELVAGKVAYRPEIEAFFRPVANIIALDRLVYRTGMIRAQGP